MAAQTDSSSTSPKNIRRIRMNGILSSFIASARATSATTSSSNAVRVSRPDAELVARCRAGDSDAFEALYREHSPRLYALARRMTGSPHESEDLLQEIFLQVHRKLDSYRGDSALGTWLYRLAIRQCLDFLRSRQGRMRAASRPLEEEGSYLPATYETPGARI